MPYTHPEDVADFCDERLDGLVCDRAAGHAGIHQERFVARWDRDGGNLRIAQETEGGRLVFVPESTVSEEERMTHLLRDLEVAEDRAIHRGDTAGAVMLRDIRRGFIRGEVSAEHAGIAVAAAAKRIAEPHDSEPDA